ncbi:MAG: pseudouridine synthase [Mariprofundaceae bacterium]
MKPTQKKQHKKTRGKQSSRPKNPIEHEAVKTPASNTQKSERINRYLAQCGLCSRREADRWVEAGRVSINGSIVETPGVQVIPGDHVCVDDKVVSPEDEKTYIMYNKPRGLMCSRKDNKGRPLIYDDLEVAANIQSVGRLDMDSEGLLLLTNDGAVTKKLIDPKSGIQRQYRVRITGQAELKTLEQLRKGGIDMGDGDVSDPWEVIVDAESKGHTWITVTIKRGRWREVRRTLQGCGHEVRRLIRVSFGSLRLSDLPMGSTRPLTGSELRKLKQIAKR